MAQKKMPTKKAVARAPIGGSVRNDILEAAVRLFSQKTFEGASLVEIAQAANISHPLVHYHFGSKEKLWKEAVDHVWSGLRHDYRAIIDASVDIEPIDTLKILCRSYAQFSIRHPQHIGLITNEVRTSGPRLEWLLDNYITPIHDSLNSIILKAIDKKQIKPMPLHHMTMMIFVSISHFFSVPPLVGRIYGVDTTDEEIAMQQVGHSIDLIFNGIVA